MTVNQYGQPIGDALPDWSARPRPGDVVLTGQHCRLEPLDADRHGRDLYEAYATAPDGRDWTYMTGGPFLCRDGFDAYLRAAAQSPDPKHYAIINLALGKAVATFSLMRIDPANGVIEVGNVAFSPLLKQKTAATEAQFLLMGYVFGDLGYRRYEWKCDSLNAPSRKAAERLGFSFEGISGRRSSTRAGLGTLPGSRSSTRNGLSSKRHSSSGWPLTISMPGIGRQGGWRTSGRRWQPRRKSPSSCCAATTYCNSLM